MGAQGAFEPLDGFEERLAAEAKRLVVDGQDVLCAGVVRHGQRLFRGAVNMNPGAIGADRHDGQVNRGGRADHAEIVGERGVSAEDDAAVGSFDEVPVVAAIGVGADAGAPVVHFESADGSGADAGGLRPLEFGDIPKPGWVEEIGGSGSGHDLGVSVLEGAESGAVEMVEVGVREQDEVDVRELDGG